MSPHNAHPARALALLALLLVSCAGAGSPSPGEWTDERSIVDSRIDRLIEGGRFEEALRAADSLRSAGVDDSRLLAQRARSLAGLGSSKEATDAFEEALLKDYESCENHLFFATFLMRTGKTGRAETEFMEAKRFCGERHYPLIYRNLAVAGIKLGKLGLARTYVDQGLEASPGDPYLSGLKGMLVAREHPSEAESLFARAQAGGEASSDFLVQYGLLLVNGGRPAEAVPVFEKAAALAPGDREIEAFLAEALDRAGRPEEAERLLRDLLAEKDDPELRRTLARTLFHEKRYREALDLYLALDRSPETMDRIAMCFQGLGKPDEALPWARKAVAARPDWPQGMINLAVILAASGELEEAEALLARVLELDPENVSARSDLDRIEAARRK
jgi:Flp pilus assembly protein TadD